MKRAMPKRSKRHLMVNGRRSTEPSSCAVNSDKYSGIGTPSASPYVGTNVPDVSQSESFSGSSSEEETSSSAIVAAARYHMHRLSNGYPETHHTAARRNGEVYDWPTPGNSPISLTEAIGSWAASETSISKQSLNRLLQTMKHYDPSVPFDARELYNGIQKGCSSVEKDAEHHVLPHWISEIAEAEEVGVTSSADNGAIHRSLSGQPQWNANCIPVGSQSHGSNRPRKRHRKASHSFSEEQGLIQVLTEMGMKIDLLSKELKDVKRICLEGFQRPKPPCVTVPKLPLPATTTEELSAWFQDIDEKALEFAATRTETPVLRTTVTNIIRMVMSKSLAQQFSWSGTSEKADKHRFQNTETHMFLTNLLKYTRHKGANQEQISDAVKKTFYNSKDWDGGRSARRSKHSDTKMQ